jgi:cellulose synthase/poly-beta-1,6-N-acetylglucosamine synthase-like glycosyltransferase
MSPVLDSACFGLARSRPHFSAARRLTTAQAVIFGAAAIVIIIAATLWPPIIAALASPAFLALATLRWACLFRWPPPASRRPRRLSDAELPVYTVLAPLHREANILEQLVSSLAALHYPRHKLDIKLVVEADDHETRHALATLGLPPQFAIVVVPPALPLTKPRP